MLIDTHVHTTRSDGISSLEEVARWARKKGLDAIIVTDHDVLYEGPKELHGVRIIPGEEVSTRYGHVLGLFLEEYVPPGLDVAETVERIQDAGGIAVAAHPFDKFRKGIGDKVFEAKFDAIEGYNGYETRPGANAKAVRVAKRLNLPITAGTDAHFAPHVGSCYMIVDEISIDGLLKGEPRCKKVGLSRLYVYLRRKLR